jgi:Putative Ig domain
MHPLQTCRLAAGVGMRREHSGAFNERGLKMRLQWWLSVVAVSLVALAVLATGAEAAAPAVNLTPTSLTFGSQAVGTTSAPQTITVTNTGTAGLFINSAQTRGVNGLDFTQVNDGCSGLTLAPGTNCSVSITFSPTGTGTRSASFILTDNAADSPQTAPVTGTGTGTNPPLTINTQFFTCTGGTCDIAAGSSEFVNNFFTTTFQASGGTAPYTWSGNPPAGETLRPSGLMVGSPTATGTQTFNVTVTDSAGAKATGTFSLTVSGPPAPTPPGCQTGGVLTEQLSGSAFNGQTPSGQATSDETQFSGCGGFSILSANVNNVNLPDGSVIWVTLDFKPVGMITLSGGSGSMPNYNMGDFAVSRDQIRIYSSLPDVGSFTQILIGTAFVGGGG